jgi:hypothetical protein
VQDILHLVVKCIQSFLTRGGFINYMVNELQQYLPYPSYKFLGNPGDHMKQDNSGYWENPNRWGMMGLGSDPNSTTLQTGGGYYGSVYTPPDGTVLINPDNYFGADYSLGASGTYATKPDGSAWEFSQPLTNAINDTIYGVSQITRATAPTSSGLTLNSLIPYAVVGGIVLLLLKR